MSRKNNVYFTVFTVTFLLLNCVAKAQGLQDVDVTQPVPGFSQTTKPVTLNREQSMNLYKLPPSQALPVPVGAIALPDDWENKNVPLTILFSQQLPADKLTVRRVGNNDGVLYLEIFCPDGAISGDAEIKMGDQSLGNVTDLYGSLWCSLKPRIGELDILVHADDKEIHLKTPTTLVEIRGRQIYLNGEPFLMKGATGQPENDAIASYVRTIGFNTLRGNTAADDSKKYGFMSIASLNPVNGGDNMYDTPDENVFIQTMEQFYLGRITNSAATSAIANPNVLIFQLGNECSFEGNRPPGTADVVNVQRRRIGQTLVNARNVLKDLCPMLPLGYANQDFSFLTPDAIDVYMHNSYYERDRYEYPWAYFLKWQGCLPPEGPEGEGRPFVNTEYGANRYIPQSYHGGPNNPILEKLHAWNLPNLWSEFMKYGTVGGTIYHLRDLDNATGSQGSSRFGILTNSRDGFKKKLACWSVAQMWRDLTLEIDGNELRITNRRDYYVRDCRLKITHVGGAEETFTLSDFSPHSTQTLSLPTYNPEVGFRWHVDFTTHSGVIGAAAGALPEQLEIDDFLAYISERETAAFLTELFDAEVFTVDGNPAPLTLFEMTNAQNIIPVVLRKPNGTTYLVPITRSGDRTTSHQLMEGVNLEIAFKGKVEKVDDMTGKPLPNTPVNVTNIDKGLRLTNIKASRIPGPIGQRSDLPFMMAVYRIIPSSEQIDGETINQIINTLSEQQPLTLFLPDTESATNEQKTEAFNNYIEQLVAEISAGIELEHEISFDGVEYTITLTSVNYPDVSDNVKIAEAKVIFEDIPSTPGTVTFETINPKGGTLEAYTNGEIDLVNMPGRLVGGIKLESGLVKVQQGSVFFIATPKYGWRVKRFIVDDQSIANRIARTYIPINDAGVSSGTAVIIAENSNVGILNNSYSGILYGVDRNNDPERTKPPYTAEIIQIAVPVNGVVDVKVEFEKELSVYSKITASKENRNANENDYQGCVYGIVGGPANWFPGNTSTGINEWIEFTFDDGKKEIEEIRLYARNNAYPAEVRFDFYIDRAIVKTQTETLPAVAGSVNSFKFSTPIEADAVRITQTKVGAGGGQAGFQRIQIVEVNIKVTDITVSGVEGMNMISVYGGTLQMLATVLPDDADNQSVTWSVFNGTGSATISATGLLTAVSDGTVTVRATANDGSEIYGEVTITISGQVVTNTEIAFAQNLKVYPNPFADAVCITGGEGCMLKVMNSAGSILLIRQITNPDEIIRLEHLPTGAYFFHFEMNEQTKTIKIVK